MLTVDSVELGLRQTYVGRSSGAILSVVSEGMSMGGKLVPDR